MKKRPSIVLLTALLAVVFAAGIGVYSSYIGMKIYQESSNNLFESFSQISKTFTLFVQRNWTVLGQWDGLLKNTGSDADAENIWPDVQGSKESWRYSDFYLLNEDSQYLTADGRKGSAGSISGVIQELYREDGPIVSTYTASYGVPKIVFAMPLSRNITLDGVTYTGLAVSYDTDVVDDLVDGSMYSGQSDCYIVRTNGDIVLALLIFFYMSFFGIRELRFLDVAVFLLLCSLWCLTDSALYQIYGRDGAAGSVISFYAFMTMPVPMVHFVRNTVSGRLRLVPDVCIALFCANALAQGAAYRLLGVPFIAMLPLTHLLLTAGVAAMLTALLRSYREQPGPQLRLRIAAFAALGAFGVAALVLYGLLHIYWYDTVFQFGVLLFIILLLYGLIGQAAGDMRFHMEHRISHQMQREDRMTGLPNRRAFEEYMERIRTGKAGCRDAVLTYIRLEGLNERNDRFGLQAGDESVIAAAQCVADFCRACEDEGESVLCFRTGGNEFALIRPEPHTDSGQLHRQFRAVVARYNRTCAPRARIIMTFGFSRLCDEDGKSRSISAWKAEADAHLKRNEAGLGGDAE